MAKKGEEFVCRACGKVSIKTGYNQKYCPDCKIPANKKVKQEWTQMVAAEKRTSLVIECKMCGKQDVKRSHNQVYCAACRKKINSRYERTVGETFECELCGKKTVRNSGSQIYCTECGTSKRKNSPSPYEQASWEQTPKERPVVKSDFTLSEVAEAARSHGMTYGRYVYEWKNGLIEPPGKFPPKKKRGRPKKNEPC